MLSGDWERLFQVTERFLHAGDASRTKRDYHEGLEKLDLWLRKAEGTLSTPQKGRLAYDVQREWVKGGTLKVNSVRDIQRGGA